MDGSTVIQIAKKYMSLEENTPKQYEKMKYPKLLPFMKFNVHSFNVKDFGSLMTMDTVAMGGLMKLSTVVFTPSTGKNIPFLLVDTMSMKKKELAYVEYYDCTTTKAWDGGENLKEKYASIPNYDEKPAWYVERRTPYSLIKGGEGVSRKSLDEMVEFCVNKYCEYAVVTTCDTDNLEELKKFQGEMITLGNPSSDTLNKVLGKDGAEEFFRTVIMPV